MSSNNDPGKVVDLQQRQAQQAAGLPTDRNAELIKALRASTLKRFGALVSGMFDGVDDALFDMAEKAENNAIQTRFFDGMREVRKKRPVMEREIQDQVSKAFSDFQNPMRRAADQSRQQQQSGSGLSLIEEGELEETLASNSMAGKAENKCSRQLYSLGQRLSHICGGLKVTDDDNPIAPKSLIRAFQTPLKELEGDMQTIKLIILKLFDKHVVSSLDVLYDELNQQLVEANVLPQLKHQLAGGGARRGPAASGMPSGPGAEDGTGSDGALVAAPPGAPMGQGGMSHMGGNMPMMPNSYGQHMQGGYAQDYGNSLDAATQAEAFNQLRSLLAARHSSYTPLPPGAMPMPGQIMSPMQQQGPTLSPQELFSALSILQNQAGQNVGQGMMYVSPSLQGITQVKGELLSQAEKLNGSSHRVAAADEDTIDLVGMLFEFILQDKNLPAEIQAQLARLQIPYLKVAILDKHLFAKKEHPARRLLDELAQSGMGWSEENDKDRRLIDRIKQIVETLLKDFDDDTGIFDREYTQFIDFASGLKKRADVAEQRTTEATLGREKLHAARKLAAREILTRMEGKAVPEAIRHVLTRPWANVLVLTMLRQGENSHQWNATLRVADELIWSAQRKDSADERSRLKALIPELEKALRQGLALVAYQESDVVHLLGELNKMYAVLLEPPAEILSTDLETGETIVSVDDEELVSVVEERVKFTPPPVSVINEETNFVDEVVLGEKGEEDTEEEMIDDKFVDVARAIRVGTWVEFRDKSGHIERAKLSWISPISAKYLFVNRKGLKVGDKTVWGLAAELRVGSAEVLEDVPLFDRALDAIVERLKTTAPSANETLEVADAHADEAIQAAMGEDMIGASDDSPKSLH